MNAKEYKDNVVNDFSMSFPGVLFRDRTATEPFRLDAVNLYGEVYLSDRRVAWDGTRAYITFTCNMDLIWISDRATHFDYDKAEEIAMAFAVFSERRVYGDEVRSIATVVSVDDEPEAIDGDQNWLWHIQWTDAIYHAAEFDYEGHLVGLPDLDIAFVPVPDRELGTVAGVAIDPITVEYED